VQNDRHDTLDNLAISHRGYTTRKKCYPIFPILAALTRFSSSFFNLNLLSRIQTSHFLSFPQYHVWRRRFAISFPITWSTDRAETKTRIRFSSRLGSLHSFYAKYLDNVAIFDKPILFSMLRNSTRSSRFCKNFNTSQLPINFALGFPICRTNVTSSDLQRSWLIIHSFTISCFYNGFKR